MDNLKTTLQKEFFNSYGKMPDVIAAAPGRLEILGNHTDYNEGFVLSMATNLKTYFAATLTENNQCSVASYDNDLFSKFSVNELDNRKKGEWINYIKGVVSELKKIRNSGVSNFNAGIISSVPLSAGMSSSAALEVSTAFALCYLCNISLSPEEYAKLGQRVENNYMGLKSGLLDQFSSIFGEENSLIFSDFRKNQVLKSIPVSSDYMFIVSNSQVKHNLVDSEYNERRESCETAAGIIKEKFPIVKTLRDVDLCILNSMKDILPLTVYKRALHIVGENKRVLDGIEYLKENDIQNFGRLMLDSHYSSMNNFENSCPELDFLVEASMEIPGCAGARLSGGGFGGIAIHLIEKNKAESFISELKKKYKQKYKKASELPVYSCEPSKGAMIL